MSPEDFELMHKHMEADRQQQEKDTRAAPGALYIDGQPFAGQITELEIPHFSPPELELPELRSPPSMELTLTITPDTAAAILEALQPAALRFLEAVAKAAKEAWEWLKRGAAKAAKIAARWADKCMDRVAFMDIYKPMYEREKQRAMTPQNLTAQIDAVAAALPDKGQHLLADREQDRRDKEEQYRRLEIGWRDQQRQALEADVKKRTQLELREWQEQQKTTQDRKEGAEE